MSDASLMSSRRNKIGFVSDLVGKYENKCSHDEAHIKSVNIKMDYKSSYLFVFLNRFKGNKTNSC